jgi:hypothetical protein
MLITAFAAGTDTILNNYLPKHTLQGNINAGLSAIMLFLVGVIFLDPPKIGRLIQEKHN